jgi:hypothetical protein
MAKRTAQTDADKHPEKYEIDGLLANTGDILKWDGDPGYCSSCNIAGDVNVDDVDRDDPDAAYYITNKTIDNCCGARWVPASSLHRDVTALPVEAVLAKDLRDKVLSGKITLEDLGKRTDELFKMLAVQHYSSGKKPFKGTCSACFTDVVLVGGAVEHEDKRICSTPAILLS